MESGKAFGEGAFPGEEVLIPDPLEDDELLRVKKDFLMFIERFTISKCFSIMIIVQNGATMWMKMN